MEVSFPSFLGNNDGQTVTQKVSLPIMDYLSSSPSMSNRRVSNYIKKNEILSKKNHNPPAIRLMSNERSEYKFCEQSLFTIKLLVGHSKNSHCRVFF